MHIFIITDAISFSCKCTLIQIVVVGKDCHLLAVWLWIFIRHCLTRDLFICLFIDGMYVFNNFLKSNGFDTSSDAFIPVMVKLNFQHYFSNL